MITQNEFDEEVECLRENRLLKLKQDKYVFYGSSSFRLWESLDDDFPEIECLNLAFGGSRIEDCIHFYHQLLGASQPVHILFYCGDNNMVEGVDITKVFEEFKRLHSLIRRDFPQVPFTFISVKPSPSKAHLLSAIADFNKMVDAFLDKDLNSFFIDIYELMLVQGETNSTLFTDDLLHMNQNGYKIWKQAIRKHLEL